MIQTRNKTGLLLATNNQGKVREYRQLLHGLPYKLLTLAECGLGDVEETGATFAENARLKATAGAAGSGLHTLADDSGLEVVALGGEPGVMSARYAGEGASDSDRIAYLLSRMKDVPWEERAARFVCVIALATPGGNTEFVSGECDGIIALTPKGERGFGYDPVFYFPELGKTMAELPPEQKNVVSHRGQAARKARELLLSQRQTD